MEEIKTLSFFGANGITSTSANHVANLAKEYTRGCIEKLSAITFYDETIGLIGNKEQTKVHSGLNKQGLDDVITNVNMIAEAHSLIAFLREAIKEKERKEKEAMEWTDEEKDNEFNRRFLDIMSAKPVKQPYPTAESIKQTWSVGEQEKCLSLEAEAAALGKLIHEEGFLSTARIDLMRKMENPSSVRLNGADTIIHRFIPTVQLLDVNAMYDALQKRYRSVQAELNGMKKKVDDEISNRKMEIDAAYNAEMRLNNQLSEHLEDEKRLYYDERDVKRRELCKQVRDLKIVIPNRLRAIYDYLVN